MNIDNLNTNMSINEIVGKLKQFKNSELPLGEKKLSPFSYAIRFNEKEHTLSLDLRNQTPAENITKTFNSIDWKNTWDQLDQKQRNTTYHAAQHYQEMVSTIGQKLGKKIDETWAKQVADLHKTDSEEKEKLKTSIADSENIFKEKATKFNEKLKSLANSINTAKDKISESNFNTIAQQFIQQAEEGKKVNTEHLTVISDFDYSFDFETAPAQYRSIDGKLKKANSDLELISKNLDVIEKALQKALELPKQKP